MLLSDDNCVATNPRFGMENSSKRTERSLKYFFQLDLVILRMIGLPSLENAFSSGELNSSWWECSCVFIGVSAIISVVLAEIVTILLCIPNDLDYVIEVLTSMWTGILCAVKGIRLWTHRRVIHKILRQLSISWDSARSCNSLKTEIVEAAENTTLIRSIYSLSVASVAISYAMRPCIILLHHRLQRARDDPFDYTISVFPTTYPFTIESFQGFLVFTSYQQFAAVIACFCWVSGDALFAQITTHISIQFTILANSLEDIIGQKNNIPGYEENIKRQLKNIAKQHNNLFTLCSSMENFFNPIIFLTLLSNGINLCCCLYQMDQLLATHDWNAIAKHVSHLISLVIQTTIYCGYAETLIQSSAQIGYSAYSSQWFKLNKECRMMLLTIMRRTAKQYEMRVYGMICLNLNRVTMIFNGAVSYFMLLKKFS